jgi:hypothetical protein
MSALNLKLRLYLGQNEILLIDSDPIMRYARVIIISSQETVEVSYAALSNEREKLVPISLAWFGGK